MTIVWKIACLCVGVSIFFVLAMLAAPFVDLLVERLFAFSERIIDKLGWKQ